MVVTTRTLAAAGRGQSTAAAAIKARSQLLVLIIALVIALMAWRRPGVSISERMRAVRADRRLHLHEGGARQVHAGRRGRVERAERRAVAELAVKADARELGQRPGHA